MSEASFGRVPYKGDVSDDNAAFYRTLRSHSIKPTVISETFGIRSTHNSRKMGRKRKSDLTRHLFQGKWNGRQDYLKLFQV